MSPGQSLIWTEVDYDKAGRQIGFLHLPHSVTRSAYGVIPIPIAVIKNGSGPTILLMAGNHGDEYEGQIALTRFVREVDPGAVEGRIIVLPAANLPAAEAGTRTSPLDDGNLNRSFPGDPERGPTAAIAHYIDSVLYPIADAMHDYHAGGASLHYLTFASARLSGDPDLDRRALAALKAFAPPLAQVWAATFDPRLSQAAANTRKLVTLGGEFGGGGDVSIDGIRLIEAGMRRLLAHFGVMELPKDAPAPPATRFVEVRDRSYYVYASERGVFEPLVRLGDDVEAGQPAARVHFIENPAREPALCHFRHRGLVVCRRALGRCAPGDCLFHLATDRPAPA
jgi:predicted deacylase